MSTTSRYADNLQARLLALLPKDGTPVTVCQLASTLRVSEYQVTSALFDPYLAHEVDYDVVTDAYSAPELLGSDTNFAAVQRTAPSGRAEGMANLGSDPKNSLQPPQSVRKQLLKP